MGFHNHPISDFGRWVVSDDIRGEEVRAVGGAESCPDEIENWKVWDGRTFSAPDLHEPWSPYIEAEKMFECRPETFEVNTQLLIHKL